MQIGLWGTGYTDSSGRQTSYAAGANASGMIVGTSDGLAFSNPWGTPPRVASWYWTPQTGTVQLSFGSTQYSTAVQTPTDAGQIAGHTYHAIAASTYHSDAWAWTHAGGYRQIGLLGQDYTTVAGARQSIVTMQNQAGQVAGTSRLVIDDAYSGQDAWVYRPGLGSVRVNPIDGALTGAFGYRSATVMDQNQAGAVAGTSIVVRNSTSNIGQATWLWSPQGGTVRVGLTTPDHTGLNGRQTSDFVENQNGGFLNAAGYAAGSSTRYTATGATNGLSAWICGPSVGTVQVGLVDALHTSATGSQDAYVIGDGVNLSGQAIGVSIRYTGGSGQDSWVRTPAGAILNIGPTGDGFTGSAGYQSSDPRAQTESGVVVGQANRVTGVSTNNGIDSWAWSAAAGTVPIGLHGPLYTGSNGYQFVAMDAPSGRYFVGEQVVGQSRTVTGVNTLVGSHTWAWSSATGTVQTGLRDAMHTGALGLQSSANVTRGATGIVGGTSARYDAAGASIGSDAWYFDPVTQNTYQPTLGVAGALRTADGFSQSSPLNVASDGAMVGQYLYFAGGAGSGEQRPFLYRPDLGFADLNDLIAGGIAGSGWASLLNIIPMGGQTQVVYFGTGQVLGQSSGTSLFVLTVPAPGAAAFAPALALAAIRRRRV